MLVWGSHKEGLLGLGYHINNVDHPTKLDCLKNICEIAISENHAVVLNVEGDVFSWGSGKYGELGLDKTIYSPFPAQSVSDKKYLKVYCSELLTCFIDRDRHFSYFGVIIKILKGHHSSITLKSLLKDESNSDPDHLFQERIVYELENERFASISTGNGFIGLLSEKGLVYTIDYSDNITLLYSKYFVYSIAVSSNQLFGLCRENISIKDEQSNSNDNNQGVYFLTRWIASFSENDIKSDSWVTHVYRINNFTTIEKTRLLDSKNKEILLFFQNEKSMNSSMHSLKEPSNNRIPFEVIKESPITRYEEELSQIKDIKLNNDSWDASHSSNSAETFVHIAKYDDSYNLKYKRKKNYYGMRVVSKSKSPLRQEASKSPQISSNKSAAYNFNNFNLNTNLRVGDEELNTVSPVLNFLSDVTSDPFSYSNYDTLEKIRDNYDTNEQILHDNFNKRKRNDLNIHTSSNYLAKVDKGNNMFSPESLVRFYNDSNKSANNKSSGIPFTKNDLQNNLKTVLSGRNSQDSLNSEVSRNSNTETFKRYRSKHNYNKSYSCRETNNLVDLEQEKKDSVKEFFPEDDLNLKRSQTNKNHTVMSPHKRNVEVGGFDSGLVGSPELHYRNRNRSYNKLSKSTSQRDNVDNLSNANSNYFYSEIECDGKISMISDNNLMDDQANMDMNISVLSESRRDRIMDTSNNLRASVDSTSNHSSFKRNKTLKSTKKASQDFDKDLVVNKDSDVNIEGNSTNRLRGGNRNKDRGGEDAVDDLKNELADKSAILEELAKNLVKAPLQMQGRHVIMSRQNSQEMDNKDQSDSQRHTLDANAINNHINAIDIADDVVRQSQNRFFTLKPKISQSLNKFEEPQIKLKSNIKTRFNKNIASDQNNDYYDKQDVESSDSAAEVGSPKMKSGNKMIGKRTKLVTRNKELNTLFADDVPDISSNKNTYVENVKNLKNTNQSNASSQKNRIYTFTEEENNLQAQNNQDEDKINEKNGNQLLEETFPRTDKDSALNSAIVTSSISKNTPLNLNSKNFDTASPYNSPNVSYRDHNTNTKMINSLSYSKSSIYGESNKCMTFNPNNDNSDNEKLDSERLLTRSLNRNIFEEFGDYSARINNLNSILRKLYLSPVIRAFKANSLFSNQSLRSSEKRMTASFKTNQKDQRLNNISKNVEKGVNILNNLIFYASHDKLNILSRAFELFRDSVNTTQRKKMLKNKTRFIKSHSDFYTPENSVDEVVSANLQSSMKSRKGKSNITDNNLNYFAKILCRVLFVHIKGEKPTLSRLFFEKIDNHLSDKRISEVLINRIQLIVFQKHWYYYQKWKKIARFMEGFSKLNKITNQKMTINFSSLNRQARVINIRKKHAMEYISALVNGLDNIRKRYFIFRLSKIHLFCDNFPHMERFLKLINFFIKSQTKFEVMKVLKRDRAQKIILHKNLDFFVEIFHRRDYNLKGHLLTGLKVAASKNYYLISFLEKKQIVHIAQLLRVFRVFKNNMLKKDENLITNLRMKKVFKIYSYKLKMGLIRVKLTKLILVLF